MKKYGLICLIFILVMAVVAWGVLRLSQGALIISAIGPTGESFYMPPQSIWKFTITNMSRSTVYWEAGIETKGDSDKNYSHAGGHIDWPEGELAAGHGLETEMIVPALSGSVWRATVRYRKQPSDTMHSNSDGWHKTPK